MEIITLGKTGRLGRRGKSLRWTRASLAALAVAISPISHARAQDDRQTQTSAAEPAETSNQGDIVVTAQRSEQNIREVPLSITALSGDELAQRGITSMLGLRGAAPNLYIEKALGGATTTSIYMRGLGQINPSFFFDAPVAIYADDVYYARAAGALVDLYDIERVEVLRGPQGTLFGRNASGGALRIITRAPDATQVEGSLEAGFGSRAQRNINGMLNLPLVADRLALRAVIQTRNNDGFARNELNGERAYDDNLITGRVALGYDAGEGFDVTLRADFLRDRSDPPPPIRLGAPTPFRYQSNFRDPDEFNNVDTWTVSGSVNIDLGGLTLSSVTAYRAVEQENRAEGDGRADTVGVFENLGQVLDDSTFSQELTVSAGDDDLKIDAGAFYFREKLDFSFQLLILPFPPFAPANIQRFNQTTDSYGLFGQVQARVGERLTLSGGLRYTWDRKDFSARQTLTATNTENPSFRFDQPFNVDKLTWRAGLLFEASDEVNLFINAATGFRAGNFNGNAQSFADITAGGLRTETNDMIEGGLKSRFLDGRLLINVGYYYQDVQNLQLAVLTGAGVTNRSLSAKIHGLEADFTLTPVQGFRIFGNVASIFDRVERVLGVRANLPFAPKWSGQLGLTYDVPVPNDRGRIVIGSDARYNSPYDLNDRNTPQIRNGDIAIWNASATYVAPGDRWSIRGEVINITDRVYNLSGFFIPGLVDVRVPSLPRRYLVTGRVSF